MKRRLSQRENLSERLEVRLTKEQRILWEEEARLDEREYLAEWVRLTIDKLIAKRRAERGAPASDVSHPDGVAKSRTRPGKRQR